MSFSLVKKTFLNAYIKLTYYDGSSYIGCLPLGLINPDNISTAKINSITEKMLTCMRSSADYSSHYPYVPSTVMSSQIIAVKSVEGYKIENTPDPITPYIEDLNCGWVGTGNGVWTPENPTNSYSDIYQVEAGIQYWLTLGDIVGTRFRVMFSTVDVSTATQAVTGVAVNKSNYNNPVAHQNIYYTPNSDGFLIIQKDNVGTSGIKTYLYYAKDL